MNVDAVDRLDLQLLHALQVNGRAGFSLLGRVLEVSDQTVSRRYARLCSRGGLRVCGTVDPHLLGETQWYVRARATPDAALPVAQAMAQRADTSWVRLISGGTEIVCAARARSSAETDALLLDKLPRTAQIRAVTAQSELHVFTRCAATLVAESGPLDDDQLAALRPDGPDTAPRTRDQQEVRLDDTDRALVDVLHRDGRAAIDVLAAAAAAPATTVRRHLEHLQSSRVLRFDVDIDPPVLGAGVQTLLWMKVLPGELHATGMALATHVEVAFAAATTGQTNLYASVMTRDNDGLYTYLTRRIAALPAVHDVEAVPVIRTVKSANAPSPAPFERPPPRPAATRRRQPRKDSAASGGS